MTFHDNILRTEVGYSRGVKHGVEKIFNKKGDLKQINKYEKGVLITDVNNIKLIDQKKTFSTNGIIHKSGGFNERGQPHVGYIEYSTIKVRLNHQKYLKMVF